MAKINKQLRDSMKMSVKSSLERFFKSRLGDDSKGLVFVMEMVDANIDLLIDSVEKGRPPTKAEIALWLAGKGVGGAKSLNSDQYVSCALAVIDLGLTAIHVELLGGGHIGIVAYIGFVMLAGLEMGGECYLAYLDFETQQRLRALETKLRDAIARNHAGVYQQTSRRNETAIEGEIQRLLHYDEKSRLCRDPNAHMMAL